MPNNPTDPAHLRNVTEELIKAITSPEVIEQMRQFREQAAAGADFSAAGEIMSLENLRSHGASLPEGFRITSRTFEDKVSGRFEDLGPEVPFDPQTDSSVGLSGCAGGGAGTVCGCAGGGT